MVCVCVCLVFTKKKTISHNYGRGIAKKGGLEQFADLRGGLVKGSGWCFWVFEWWRTGRGRRGLMTCLMSYVHYVPYTTLIGKLLPLLTSEISTTLSRAFLVLLLLKRHYYIQCPHYFLAQASLLRWTISLRCVILVRS